MEVEGNVYWAMTCLIAYKYVQQMLTCYRRRQIVRRCFHYLIGLATNQSQHHHHDNLA